VKDLPMRIKFMRETLGKTQKEMASLLGIGQRTWQNYEEGVHEPSWKALNGLAGLGINANWLLTGQGEVLASGWRNIDAPGIGERIKIIRGDVDKKVFANRIGIEEDALDAYENELLSPDVNFLASLCRDFKIKASWLLLGSGPRKSDDYIIYEEERDFIAKIDVETLRDVLESIKESLLELTNKGYCDESSIIDIEENAELIAFLYEDSVEHESKYKSKKQKKATIKRLFAIAKKLNDKQNS